MKKGIVFKLFILTTVLCMLILACVFVGQTVFFKQYYVNKKINTIKTNIQSFKKDYVKNKDNLQSIQRLEQDFSRNNNASITLLDTNGNLKNGNDFYIEVKVEDSSKKELINTTLIIPLYNLINIGDISLKEHLSPNKKLLGYFVSPKTSTTLVPYHLVRADNDQEVVNQKLVNQQILKKVDSYFGGRDVMKQNNLGQQNVGVYGKIQTIHIPEENTLSNSIYTNHLFMQKVNEFQAKILFDEERLKQDTLQILEKEENGIKYRLFIQPITEPNGETTYIFALASLQPVDEAIQMIKDYYIYIIIFALSLIFLAAFYYSKKIAKPLLQINTTTQKMAKLDFSEAIPITSKDEIGDLSQNINILSTTLHSYINNLQQDIEKEKQLEHTRKEFIAGVSHELKTPLSIMTSCMSILKDGVASHKKDYYFKAMETEVNKMNLLIVDMLELAKLESGTYKMEMRPFLINKTIEHICEHLSFEIKNKQLNVQTSLSEIEVLANPHRIEQVITNFITNAIRYTPENERIIISAEEESTCVKICIENKGSHIPEEQLSKIWERFYRGDTSRQRSTGGTGLGLAISKNILDLHGVQYGASNTKDGVLFFFYLNKNV
ncbi:cell wall metabolism sensor histidine kinase WalK [Bacillus cereus group sp. BfR-BA-01380]|uniref:sensor histidine kinase n=1 Tax=Bacillus cereus group sp. BfR-BA-01380 TaxID=2920324 RepID=UPI001F5923CD|nr:sensor histidine kinase [Bacillus cereus group sp. BfR-BA-01380]